MLASMRTEKTRDTERGSGDQMEALRYKYSSPGVRAFPVQWGSVAGPEGACLVHNCGWLTTTNYTCRGAPPPSPPTTAARSNVQGHGKARSAVVPRGGLPSHPPC